MSYKDDPDYQKKYLEAWHALEYREPGEPGYGAGPDDPAPRFTIMDRALTYWVTLGLVVSVALFIYVCLVAL